MGDDDASAHWVFEVDDEEISMLRVNEGVSEVSLNGGAVAILFTGKVRRSELPVVTGVRCKSTVIANYWATRRYMQILQDPIKFKEC